MNKKILFLTKNSIIKKMKSKWFLLINALLCIVIVGLINIDSIIHFFGGDFNEKLEIVVVDNTNEVYEFKDLNHLWSSDVNGFKLRDNWDRIEDILLDLTFSVKERKQ